MVLQISKEGLQAEAQVYTGQISSWTNQIFSELQVYQNAIESGVFANDDEILKYLETTCNRSEAYPVGLYMGDDSGVYLDGSGWVPEGDWVLVERDWYPDSICVDGFVGAMGLLLLTRRYSESTRANSSVGLNGFVT